MILCFAYLLFPLCRKNDADSSVPCSCSKVHLIKRQQSARPDQNGTYEGRYLLLPPLPSSVIDGF